MNILFVTHYCGMGGASVALLSLLDELKKNRVEVFVLLPHRGELENELEKRKIKYDFIPFQAGVIEKKWKLKNYFYMKQLKNTLLQFYLAVKIYPFIRKWKIDIIHANSTYVLCGTLAGKLAHVKTIWHLREDISGQFDATFFPVPCFVRWTFNHSDQIIAVSKYIENHYNQYNQIKNMITVYDGTQVYSMKENYGLHKPIRILYTGGLSRGKGIHEILTLCSANDMMGIIDYEIYMVGVSNIQLKTFSEENNWNDEVLNKLVTIGRCSRKELDQLRKEMDVFFMPSEFEALGLVTTEAMLMGLPIIGANSGATKELLGDNSRGYLYKFGNSEELGKQMKVLLEDNIERMKRISNAREWAEKNCLPEICAQKIYDIYEKL